MQSDVPPPVSYLVPVGGSVSATVGVASNIGRLVNGFFPRRLRLGQAHTPSFLLTTLQVGNQKTEKRVGGPQQTSMAVRRKNTCREIRPRAFPTLY